MTISKRLIILISTLISFLILIALISVQKLNRQVDSVNWINVNITPSLVVIDSVNTEFATLQGLILRQILSPSDADMAKTDEEIKAKREKISSNLNMYLEKLISDDRDKTLLLADQAKVKEYYQLIDQILALSRSHQLDKATAMALSARSSIDAAETTLKQHADYNLKLQNDMIERAQNAAHSGLIFIILITIVATIIGVGIGVISYKEITNPLLEMKSTISAVSVNLDFTQRVALVGKDEVTDTANAFNHLLERLQESLKKMRGNAEQVGHSATHLSTAAQQVFTSSDDQSEASSSMAAAIEELTVSIDHIADRAGDANSLVINAGKIAREGAVTISKTLSDIREIEVATRQASETVTRLDEGSAKVNHVIAVIKEVAEQTNLLALNAAIEAARAGEQGRGFAVVADEVRRLAERTAQSTQEIAATITDMQHHANNAVSSILAAVSQVETSVHHAMDAEKAIQQIELGAEQTVAIVGEIADAISEQSSASSIIAQQVERIAQMSEENSVAAKSTAQTSTNLDCVAKDMYAEIERYSV